MIRHLLILFFAVFFACKRDANIKPSEGTPTSDKTVYTQDIDNFWQAYDSIKKVDKFSKKLDIINTLYIDRGTEGLRAFMELRDYSDTLYVELIDDLPLFWKSIRAKTLSVKSRENEINASIETLRAIYPELKPAKIYFTIGGMRSGGTVKGDKSLIGCEIAMADKEVDVSEFESLGHDWLIPFFQSQNSAKLVEMNVHEFVHTQQKNMGVNLLSQALHEGSCDFITELVTEGKLTAHYMQQGRKNESMLKKDFFQEAFETEYDNWFYNADSKYGIQDLGYYMGYAICKSYYVHAENKTLAIKQIIELDHADMNQVVEFVNRSGYFEIPLEVEP